MRRNGAKIATLGLAAALVVGAMPMAFAADSYPPDGEQARGRAQPHVSGYRVQDLSQWSPETDPYAELLRAQVPLQERVEPYRATQANPDLTGEAEIMLMQGDYGNSFFDATPYNNDYTEHAFNFWQYVDYWASWHGRATLGTPQNLYDPATSDWRSRGFEFGILDLPNPAYTNAAHRNGVKSIATVYFDPAFRPGLTFTEMFEKDERGEYHIAKQLVEMAEYYGYDGYFLNQEEVGDEEEFKPFMAYLTAQGLWTQWYDTNSAFDAAKAQWLVDDTYGRISDSVFVNYDWPKYLDYSLTYARRNGFDAHTEVFMGVEANQAKFSGSHISASQLPLLYEPGTNNPRAAVALFTPSDFYQRALDDNLTVEGYDRPLMQTPGFQWMIHERERMYFSGVKEDPTDTGVEPGYARPDVAVPDASGWVGVADFAPAQSVASGETFYSWFNTGHGMQYFRDGDVASDEQWANMNVQDILPSWQWWLEGETDGLDVDFDYGATLPRRNVAGEMIDPLFTPVGAFHGGSSVVVHGDLAGPSTLRLFKTDLDVDASTAVDITYRKTSDDDAVMDLAVIFEDAPDVVERLSVEGSADSGDWRTVTVPLGAFEGRQVATLGLVFDGDADDYQMNIGGIRYTSDDVPSTQVPAGFEVSKLYASGEAVVTWTLGDFERVDQYNIYGSIPGGSPVYLGGTFGDAFYIKDLGALLASGEDITFELRPVGKDGVEGPPATVTYEAGEVPTDIVVAEALDDNGNFLEAVSPEELDVEWSVPAEGAPDGYRISVVLQNLAADDPDSEVYTVDVPGDATSATVPVPVTEGYVYDLAIRPVAADGSAGEPIYYRGRTHDSFAEPLPRSDVQVSDGQFAIATPSPSDWYTLTVSFDGEELFTATRGAGGVGADDPNEGLQQLRELPADDGTLTFVVTDYAGNVSEATTVTVVDGEAVEDPTPAPTETPSPTPSPTETPSPTPSPTDTPTETPSPTPTDSPSPTPTDSPGVPGAPSAGGDGADGEPGAGDDLPRTGADAPILALVILLAGGCALLLARRRATLGS